VPPDVVHGLLADALAQRGGDLAGAAAPRV